MFNLSDSELDRLSRKAAEAYEVETNSSSWDALEKMLDKELGPVSHPVSSPPRSFRFPFAYTSMVVLVVGAGYFFFSQPKKKDLKDQGSYVANSAKSSDNKSPSIIHNADRVVIPPKEKEDSKNTIDSNNTKNKNDLNSTLANKNNTSDQKTSSNKSEPYAFNKQQGAAQKSLMDEKLGTKNNADIARNETKSVNGLVGTKLAQENTSPDDDKSNAISSSIVNSKNNKSASSLYHSRNSNNRNRIFGNKNGHGNKKLPTDISTSTNSTNALGETNQISGSLKKEKNQQVESSNTEENAYAPLPQVAYASSHTRIQISDSALIAEAEKLRADKSNFPGKKTRSLITKRPLQIGLSFAPDISKVKYLYDNNRMGSTLGITLDYEIVHRLSVNTGVFLAHKYYKASEDDFHLQRTVVSAAPNYEVEFLDASCKMLDIPINLRYDISLEGNNRFFVSSGLSSYIMTNQSYVYFYRTNPFGFQGWADASYNTPQNYWFSMLNLSMGFETSISNSFSLQVEPYAKMPLRQVGVGNVSLTSYGINLGLKYAPVLKRSRN